VSDGPRESIVALFDADVAGSVKECSSHGGFLSGLMGGDAVRVKLAAQRNDDASPR
jgi:hypothetical protein